MQNVIIRHNILIFLEKSACLVGKHVHIEDNILILWFYFGHRLAVFQAEKRWPVMPGRLKRQILGGIWLKAGC